MNLSHKHMHITLEVAQTIFLSEDRKQMLQGRVLVIEVQCCGIVFLMKLKRSHQLLNSFKNSLRVLDFDRAF